tara:strand:- start:1689 stop:2111 length:423 start_codon:yes stop_codon:yes gene_type:complete
MRNLLKHSIWLGPLITLVGFLSYFLIFAKYPVLRDVPWVNIPLVTLGGVLTVAGLWRGWNNSRWIKRCFHCVGSLFSVGIAGLLFFYVFSYSYGLPVTSETTKAIERAPDFSLSDANGNLVSLADYRGKKVVISFYRGFW